MSETSEHDIVRRVVTAMSRTSKPRASAYRITEDYTEVVGTVPKHLRHLHNLLAELIDEAESAQEQLYPASEQVLCFERALTVRSLFFSALKTYVPVPEGASSMMVLKSWDVAAYFIEEDDAAPSIQDMLSWIGLTPNDFRYACDTLSALEGERGESLDDREQGGLRLLRDYTDADDDNVIMRLRRDIVKTVSTLQESVT
jgi:hypothetical protein